MKQLIEMYSDIGVTEEQTPSERRAIHIVNQASIAAVLFSVLFLFTNLYSGFYDVVLPSVCSGLSFAFVPYLNYRKKYFAAKRLFVGIGMLATTIVVSMSELHTNMYYYFASVFAAILVFFPKKKYLKRILSITFICISSSMLISYFGLLPKLSLLNPLFLGVINILLIILIIYVLIATLMKENHIFEQKTIQLLKNINERNLELSAEKEKVEITAEVLIETNAHLHQEVNEREKVERSLRASNHTLQQFTYVASHDMKEPLRTISSFSGLLARRLDSKLDEREQEYLDFITNGVKRMSVLVDDLLKYAPLNNPVTFEKIDLNNTIIAIKHSLINLLNRKNGKVEIGEMPVLYANRSQLNQLFQNLISNGLKFNNKENPEIRIDCQEQETDYLFSVSDNGIGIAEEHQEKIWMLFQRLHTREQFEGSGIGLSVAQKVVTNHQGSIWVESKQDQGTTFYFTISKNLCASSKKMAELQGKIEEEIAQN